MKCQKCKSIKCKNKCGTPPDPDTEPCMYPYQNNAPWTVTPLVHVAGRASRLAPSLTALRDVTVPVTDINDTWWRNIADEAWIASNPLNSCNMVIVTRQDVFQGGCLATVVMYTLDNGKTWNESDISFSRMQGAAVQGSTVPPQQGGDNADFVSASDPCVCFDRKGNVYVLTTSFNFDEVDENFQEANVVSKSTNGGQSFTHLVATTRDDGLSNFLDRPNISADPYRDDIIYVVGSNLFPRVDDPPNRSAVITFQKSVDGGATWSPPVTAITTGDADGLPGLPWGATLQVLNDANRTLVITVSQGVLATQGTPVGIFVGRSTNGGQTWTQSQPFSNVVPSAPFDPADPTLFIGAIGENDPILGIDSAYNKQNNTLYMTWSDPRFNPNLVPSQTWRQAGVVVSRSTNGGLTWSTPVPANPTTLGKQAFLSSIAVLDNGIVAVLFYDIRNFTGGPNLKTDAWVSFFDKNLNFLTQVRLTPTSFDMRQTIHKGQNGWYSLGDYVKIASRGQDFIAAFPITNPPYGVPPAPIPGAMFIYDPRPRQDVVFARLFHSVDD